MSHGRGLPAAHLTNRGPPPFRLFVIKLEFRKWSEGRWLMVDYVMNACSSKSPVAFPPRRSLG